MKKLLVIFLVGLFMLHHVGYYFVYVSVMQHNETEFQARLYNDEFNQENLKKASIPIALPYQQSQDEYQKVGKKLNIQGEYYRVIKMKYARDTLHLVYIDDVSTEKLNNSLEKWISGVTENDTSTPSDNAVVKILKNAYYLCVKEFHFSNQLYTLSTTECLYFNHYKAIQPSIPTPPPQSLV